LLPKGDIVSKEEKGGSIAKGIPCGRRDTPLRDNMDGQGSFDASTVFKSNE
jgi:hypothetical protein